EPFTVILDNTWLGCPWTGAFDGAVRMVLRNGSRIEKNGACYNHGFGNQIKGLARIEVETGCVFDFTSGSGSLNLAGSTSESSITVKDGGVYMPANVYGTGKMSFISEDGVVAVGKKGASYSALFTGFGTVEIPEGKTLTIRSSSSGGGGSSDWNRLLKTASAAVFTGAGDVVVSNGYLSSIFHLTMTGKANTCTGSISVDDPPEGANEMALFFDNGANWAGTVRSTGYMATTNTADAASTASVSFGALQLQRGTLRLRGLRDAETGAIAIDQVNLASPLVRESGDKGMVAITEVAFGERDTAVLGTAPAQAWQGARFTDAAGNRLSTKESEPDPDTGLVTVSIGRFVGTLLILR
ncbi:MAG: hypothetical protein SPK06_07750, partial [Kiritimatiellia bacterium]|nr:hypothetical protein [Kiritimatiellia bacterium]